ncbi:unnamed protein product, partial [Meganyctiphanes norvegica]
MGIHKKNSNPGCFSPSMPNIYLKTFNSEGRNIGLDLQRDIPPPRGRGNHIDVSLGEKKCTTNYIDISPVWDVGKSVQSLPGNSFSNEFMYDVEQAVSLPTKERHWNQFKQTSCLESELEKYNSNTYSSLPSGLNDSKDYCCCEFRYSHMSLQDDKRRRFKSVSWSTLQ